MKTTQSNNDNNIDVTLLVTFHNEGVLAHSTLNSIERCREYAEKADISTEYVWVLDSVDEETLATLLAHPANLATVKMIHVDFLDSGAARNAGIAAACGKAIAIMDGDDYFSTNWIERAWHSLKEYGTQAILHPEMFISFGAEFAYGWHVDQLSRYYDKHGLLMNNYWTSWTFALRSVYERCPYVTTRTAKTGFGYEDWHWNCETIAAEFQHRLVPGTIGFYRKKKVSRASFETSMGAIIPPSRLFNKNYLRSTE
jgi:glycosyltransferase involved in cell wall biosynthesis